MVVTDFGVIPPEGKLEDFRGERRDKTDICCTTTAGSSPETRTALIVAFSKMTTPWSSIGKGDQALAETRAYRISFATA